MKRWTRSIAIAMAVSALLLTVIGCDEQPSTASSGVETLAQADQPEILSLADNAAKGFDPRGAARSVTVVIGPEGGTISVAPVKLTVPAGALDAPVAIRMTVPSHGLLFCDFAPDGLVFDKPAVLSLDVTAVIFTGHLEALTWFWWNPETEMWEDIGATLALRTLSLNTEIGHFSRYAPGGRAGW